MSLYSRFVAKAWNPSLSNRTAANWASVSRACRSWAGECSKTLYFCIPLWLSRSHSELPPHPSQGGRVRGTFSVTSVGNLPRVTFNHFSVTLREPHYLLHFRHLRPTRVVDKPARVSPEGVTNFTQISFGAPMPDQRYPNGIKKCWK